MITEGAETGSASASSVLERVREWAQPPQRRVGNHGTEFLRESDQGRESDIGRGSYTQDTFSPREK